MLRSLGLVRDSFSKETNHDRNEDDEDEDDDDDDDDHDEDGDGISDFSDLDGELDDDDDDDEEDDENDDETSLEAIRKRRRKYQRLRKLKNRKKMRRLAEEEVKIVDKLEQAGVDENAASSTSLSSPLDSKPSIVVTQDGGDVKTGHNGSSGGQDSKANANPTDVKSIQRK